MSLSEEVEEWFKQCDTFCEENHPSPPPHPTHRWNVNAQQKHWKETGCVVNSECPLREDEKTNQMKLSFGWYVLTS